MQLHREDHDQHQGDDEFGYRLEEHGDDEHHRIDPGVFLQGGQDAEQDAEDGADGHGSEGDFRTGQKPRCNLLKNRLACTVGSSEIPADNPADIADVLDNDRVIESQFFSFCLNLFFCCVIAENLPGRISRSNRLQGKYNS